MRYTRDRIRDLREDNDLTQNQVAEMLDIYLRKYSYIENDIMEPSKEILIKLAEYYDTSVDYLLGLTDVKDPYPKGRRWGDLSL
jgi:transcriptional regulator with XRE-family HTH domain